MTELFPDWTPPREVRFGPFCASYRPGLGWFRIFGVGLKWKDTTRHELLFSERQRITGRFRIGRWLIGGLR